MVKLEATCTETGWELSCPQCECESHADSASETMNNWMFLIILITFCLFIFAYKPLPDIIFMITKFLSKEEKLKEIIANTNMVIENNKKEKAELQEDNRRLMVELSSLKNEKRLRQANEKMRKQL